MPLFQKRIEPHCIYCTHGRALDDKQVVCPKKGVMAAGSYCRSIKYDPLKRVPPRPVKLSGLTNREDDFKL